MTDQLNQQQHTSEEDGFAETAVIGNHSSIPWMRNALERLDPKMCLFQFLQQQTRPDGRCFYQARPTRLVKGILGRQRHASSTTSNIAGSAMIHLGNTVILSAVTLQVGQPMAGCHPEWGDVVIQMEHAVSASTSSSSSSSTAVLSKTAQWLERRLLESNVIDLSQLCLVPGYAAWRLHITVLIIQDDGNIADASLTCVVAALRDTQLPATQLLQQPQTIKGGGGSLSRDVVTILSDQPSHPLIVTTENIPFSLSLVIFEEQLHNTSETKTHLLVDPTALEEAWIQDRLTLVVATATAKSSSPDILYISSHHGALVDIAVLSTAFHLAQGRAQELMQLLS